MQMVTGLLSGMIKVIWNYIVVVGHSGYTKIRELCILRVSI